MEQQVVTYIKKHTFTMTVLVTAGFILLAMGELFLYKQQMEIKQMVSEGFMQVKEMNYNQEQGLQPTPAVKNEMK